GPWAACRRCAWGARRPCRPARSPRAPRSRSRRSACRYCSARGADAPGVVFPDASWAARAAGRYARVVDAERRSDERRAATGDPEAAVRALLGRVRSGEVSAEALEVAARLGSCDALRALDRPAPAVPSDLDWLAQLGALGGPIVVRALVAA